MTHTHTFAIVDQSTRETVKADLIRVERLPSETDAYFIPHGHYKVLTSNGESKCEGPVWILWDKGGYPYPITPDEFEAIYRRKRDLQAGTAPTTDFYQNVRGCARCGEDHDGLKFEPMVNPIKIPNSDRQMTHATVCPTTTHPILLEVVKEK